MMRHENAPFEFDVINYWSEVKLDIIKDYARAYSTIMAKQQWCKGHFYIDAFAGAGMHISKATGEFIPGSPLNAQHHPSFQPLLSDRFRLRKDGQSAAAHKGISERHGL